MNFSFGEVLTSAGRITWKYKSLWLPGIIIALAGLLSLPINLIFGDPFASLLSDDPAQIEQRMGSMMLANGLILLLSIASIPVYIIGMTIPSLATRRLDTGEGRVTFIELLKDALRYFWRILGIFALIWGGMFAFVLVFMACIALLSAVTFGLASLCAFPLFLLFIPLAMFVYSFLEQGMNAVVVDDLGIARALERAWDLVRKNMGVMALLCLLIYLVSLVASTVISVPAMIPMFGFMMNINPNVEPDLQMFDTMFRNMMVWMLALSPFYAVCQGIFVAFTQSAWTLTYLRLTKPPQDNAPIVLEANA